MQLNFSTLTPEEKLPRLKAWLKANLLVVVRCGPCQIIHSGALEAINGEGTVIALNCLTESYRVEYAEREFTRHERHRNRNGELIKNSDKWQYIPIALIDKVICMSPKYFA